MTRSPEVIFDGAVCKLVPEDCVIHAALPVLHLLDDLIIAAVVAILGGKEALGQHFVIKFSPRCNEGCERLVIFMEGDAVVTIFSIETGFPGVRRY